MVAINLAPEPFTEVTVIVGRSVYPLPLLVTVTPAIPPTVSKVSGSRRSESVDVLKGSVS